MKEKCEVYKLQAAKAIPMDRVKKDEAGGFFYKCCTGCGSLLISLKHCYYCGHHFHVLFSCKPCNESFEITFDI